MPVDLRHVRKNESANRYELVDPDGHVLGVADYDVQDGVVVLPHTEVDIARRGNGLGAELVRGALDEVRASGGKVRPLCWYVASFIEEHPDYQDLVAS